MNLFSLLATAFMALAQPAPNMSAGEIYARCYDRFVHAPISMTDATFLAVKAGTKDATTACMDLLKKGNLKSVSGQLEISNTNDPIARKVFQNMHMLHNSWFESRALSAFTTQTLNVMDFEQPALYYTRSLFKPSTSVREVLTLNGALSGVRKPPIGAPVINHFKVMFPNSANTLFTFGYENHATPSAPFEVTVPNNVQTQAGDLVGIRTSPAVTEDGFFIRTTNTAVLRGPAATDLNNTQISNEVAYLSKQPQNLNQHFGGGILGSPVFIMQNTNMQRNYVAYKEYINHRRLASRVFETLLCHQLPTLLDADVATISGSPHAFENSKSCMQCHSSIDPLARTYKKIILNQSHRNTNTAVSAVMGAFQLGADHTNTPAAQQDWVMKPIDGKIYYRSLKDTKASVKPTSMNVSSIADLGAKLSDPATNMGYDFYACTAKRYYEYFTGVKVEMRPNAQENSVMTYHRSLVLNLANSLKSNGNMQTLVENIIKSVPFRMRNSYSEEVGP